MRNTLTSVIGATALLALAACSNSSSSGATAATGAGTTGAGASVSSPAPGGTACTTKDAPAAAAAPGGAASSSDAAAGGTKGSGVIGISMPTKTSERWIADGDNMVKQFQAKGYQTDLEYAEDKSTVQITQLEGMITKKVKALVIAAKDGKSLVDVLAKAKAAGIPVIAYDRLIRDSDAVSYYATFDNFKVGVLQAHTIVDRLDGTCNIELFAGSPDDNNAKFFFDGAMSVIQPLIDGGKLKVLSGQTKYDQVGTLNWDGATAQKRMEDIISKAYSSANVDAVLSPYDGITRGIISALSSAGYGQGSKKLPITSGQDAEVASVKSIIAGQQTATIYKDTRQLAGVAVTMVDDVVNGKTPQTNDTKTYDNGVKVVPSMLLNPIPVDKSNYKQVLIDGGYYTADQLK